MTMCLRTGMLYGSENLEKLKKAKVCVVGLGAVGGAALEALARTSVGSFLLIDFDVTDATNINRQVLALNSTTGQKKCLLAKARVADINPNCAAQSLDIFFCEENAHVIKDYAPDIVIDAIDSFSSKLYLLKYCTENKIPVISSMGAALKTDLSLAKLSTISKTSVCPLAKKIRTALKKDGFSADIPCVYSLEPPQQICCEKPKANETEKGYKARLPLGSGAVVTTGFGLYIASYVIDFIISNN